MMSGAVTHAVEHALGTPPAADLEEGAAATVDPIIPELSDAVVPALHDALVPAVTHADLYWAYTPASGMYHLLTFIQTSTGMPWWAVVAVSTITARTVLFPIVVHTMRSAGRMQKMKPEMDKLQARMTAAKRDGPAAQQRVAEEYQELTRKHNVNPFSTLMGPLAQMPVFMSFFFATRRLAELEPSVAAGDFYWVPSLAEADPTYILPAITGLSMLTVVQLGGDTGAENQEMMGKMKIGMSVVAVSIPVLTYSFPALVFSYWIASNAFSMVQVPTMKLPAVKHALGIPVAAAKAPEEAEDKKHRKVVVPGQYAHVGSFNSTPPLPTGATAEAEVSGSGSRADPFVMPATASKAKPGAKKRMRRGTRRGKK